MQGRDRLSLNILNEVVDRENRRIRLDEMPQRMKIRKKVTGYDFKDLNYKQKERLTGVTGGSDKDANEKFREDAKLDLTERFNKVIPNIFTPKYGSPMSLKDDDSFSGSMYIEYKPKEFVEYMCSKFPELEVDPEGNNYEYENDFSINYKGEHESYWGDREAKLRKVLSNLTNFDDLRRQQKVAINNYLIELLNALTKAIQEHITEFSKVKKNYDKYTNLSAKEKEEELSKNWYDQYGKVIRAKNLDESFIKEYGLTEAQEIDVEDYIEIYDFDELNDYAKEKISDRKVRLQIQKMFDRMTEILEADFTEYMAERGLTLEPGNFDIESLLYNMTHESNGRYYGPQSMTKFYVTKSELASYIKNNEDLVEKYGQKLIDRLFDFMTTDRGDSQPVYTIYYDGGKGVRLSGNFSFKHYDYDKHKDVYYDKADSEIEQLYDDLQKELALDFYSSYKLLDKNMKQLRNEAKEIVYAKIAKSKDKYLYNGEKFDKNKYDVIDEEPSENE